jgi:hypothetical protein
MRYIAGRSTLITVSDENLGKEADQFPDYIPLSADSKDILAYIEQPVEARTPVGYQRDFLDAYLPNVSFYLSTPIRNQLARMGDAKQASQPAGTYGRAMLDRLLIDLSWASSHLEGNTYSRLDTVELIEHGKAAAGKAALETQMILNLDILLSLKEEDSWQLNYSRLQLITESSGSCFVEFGNPNLSTG